MTRIDDVRRFLERYAPARFAEDWDNVGLLVGRADRPVRSVMTCLTITRAVVDECVAARADLIVTHHPLPFQPLKRITDETVPGDLLLRIIEARVAVYSPHTAFDSAARGINQRLAESIGLGSIEAIVERSSGTESSVPAPDCGAGRWGLCGEPTSIGELAERLRRVTAARTVQLAGGIDDRVSRVAVACGSAGSFLDRAARLGCELFVTGETGLHTVLEARARGVAMLLLGHYASERFAVERLAEELARAFDGVRVWASGAETDPLDAIGCPPSADPLTDSPKPGS
ncbi:MAG: Nif3-like dinuclear metal center hexameric protein [Planctomycetes bacterium]|nr:Nif3-like dinuclear metal center hexameric protein [Planctomycetota bacterium]